MTEPRRVLISWDVYADGIRLVGTTEEEEATLYEEWSRVTKALYEPPGPPLAKTRPWGDLLSDPLLDDLKTWNDSWGPQGPADLEVVQVLQERGRELAIRVQNELGTDGWEVLYLLGGRVHRVHPPDRWPAETWEQDLLGYAPRGYGRATHGPHVTRPTGQQR